MASAPRWPDTREMQRETSSVDNYSDKHRWGAHAVLLPDRAGWQTTTNLDVPENITPIFLSSRVLEPNPIENIWQYLRDNWLSSRDFENHPEIIEAVCDARQKLATRPETITSIGLRQWALLGHTEWLLVQVPNCLTISDETCSKLSATQT